MGLGMVVMEDGEVSGQCWEVPRLIAKEGGRQMQNKSEEDRRQKTRGRGEEMPFSGLHDARQHNL